MGEIRPSHYIMGILVFCLFIGSVTAVVVLTQEKIPGFVQGDRFNTFNNTFNVLPEVQQELGEINSDIENTPSDMFGSFGVLNSLINGAWNTLQFLSDAFNFMDVAFEGLTEFLQVPDYVVTILGLMILVVILFAILAAIFQIQL